MQFRCHCSVPSCFKAHPRVEAVHGCMCRSMPSVQREAKHSCSFHLNSIAAAEKRDYSLYGLGIGFLDIRMAFLASEMAFHWPVEIWMGLTHAFPT